MEKITRRRISRSRRWEEETRRSITKWGRVGVGWLLKQKEICDIKNEQLFSTFVLALETHVRFSQISYHAHPQCVRTRDSAYTSGAKSWLLQHHLSELRKEWGLIVGNCWTKSWVGQILTLGKSTFISIRVICRMYPVCMIKQQLVRVYSPLAEVDLVR